MFIHALVRKGIDDDIAAWYNAQKDKSEAIRELVRLAIQADKNGGQEAAVKKAVAEVLQQCLPDLVSAAVSRAMASYRLAPAEQANEGDADEQERERARSLMKAGLGKLPLEED